MSLISRIVGAFRGAPLSREIEDHASHFGDVSGRNRDRGDVLGLGSAQLYREASGNARVILWLDSLRSDFVLAWRRLRKSKVTSSAAILSLAFGTGACLATFQLIDALLFRPLPIAAPDRLYALSRQEFPRNGQPTSRETWEYPLFTDMRCAVASQATVIAVSNAERVEMTWRSDSEMERAAVQYVSGNMFGTFGLHAASGRLLSQSDDLRPGAHPVAVLSHDYWLRRFAQDPQVIGRTFRLTNNLTGTRIYRIVGVGEAGFIGSEPGKVTDIFLPATMLWAMAFPAWSPFRIFVHLRPDISVELVRDRLSAILAAFNDSKGNTLKQALEWTPAPAGSSAMQKNYRASLATLGGLVLLVLLIACANVANLMTAQATARSREMALRVSLGARRWRLRQLVLVEAAIIGIVASAVGWCFAQWSAPLVLARVNPPDDPARLSLTMGGRTLACAAVLTLFVSLLFGVAPALRASAIRPADVLKGGDSP